MDYCWHQEDILYIYEEGRRLGGLADEDQDEIDYLEGRCWKECG